MINIILVEPKTPGNIGAIARVMKNFGYKDLILINPKCAHLSQEALDRASHAQDVLKKAKVLKSFPKLDYLVATTGKLGTDYNLKRSPLNPEQLADKIKNTKNEVGIVFGREDIGLKNDEIAKCDFSVTVDTNPKYPILNLSHAVGIILYEISKGKNKLNKIETIDLKQKEELLKLLDKTLDGMNFKTPEKKDTQKLLWKRVIGKAMLTKREFMALMGYFKKV